MNTTQTNRTVRPCTVCSGRVAVGRGVQWAVRSRQSHRTVRLTRHADPTECLTLEQRRVAIAVAGGYREWIAGGRQTEGSAD